MMMMIIATLSDLQAEFLTSKVKVNIKDGKERFGTNNGNSVRV